MYTVYRTGFFLEASRISVCMIILKHLSCCSTTSNDYMALAVFALVHILTVFGLVCDVMSVMQLSIMEHNGITLKEKLVRFASIEEKHNGVSFEHNFLMPRHFTRSPRCP